MTKTWFPLKFLVNEIKKIDIKDKISQLKNKSFSLEPQHVPVKKVHFQKNLVLILALRALFVINVFNKFWNNHQTVE